MRQVTKHVTAATEETAAALSTARNALEIQFELHEHAIDLIAGIAIHIDSIPVLLELVRLKELLRTDELERIEAALETIQAESASYRAAAKQMYAESLKRGK